MAADSVHSLRLALAVVTMRPLTWPVAADSVHTLRPTAVDGGRRNRPLAARTGQSRRVSPHPRALCAGARARWV